MLTPEQIYNYFAIILRFANRAKVKELFAKLGYHIDEPSAELCVQATDEYGVEFTKPFGHIAAIALESPKYQSYMKVLAAGGNSLSHPLNKADGKKQKEQMTNDQKIQLAGTVLGSITSWLDSGKAIADTVVNKDANAANAQANLLTAQALAKQQNTDSTNKWLIPVIIIVAIVVLGGIIGAVAIANKRS